jgi:hypothetical protein
VEYVGRAPQGRPASTASPARRPDGEDEMSSIKAFVQRDEIWLWLCVTSLVCYLLRSEAVSAFAREVAHLWGKF